MGAAETVTQILERIPPVRARVDRERQKGIAGDGGGIGDYEAPVIHVRVISFLPVSSMETILVKCHFHLQRESIRFLCFFSVLGFSSPWVVLFLSVYTSFTKLIWESFLSY